MISDSRSLLICDLKTVVVDSSDPRETGVNSFLQPHRSPDDPVGSPTEMSDEDLPDKP